MGEDIFEGLTFDEWVRRNGLGSPQSPEAPPPGNSGKHAGHGHTTTGEWGMALSDWISDDPGRAARLAAEVGVDVSPAGFAKAAMYDVPRAARGFAQDPSLFGAADVFLSGLGALPGGAMVGKGLSAVLATVPFLARPTRAGVEQAQKALKNYDPRAISSAIDEVIKNPETVSLAFIPPQSFLDLAPEFGSNYPGKAKIHNLMESRARGELSAEIPELFIRETDDLRALRGLQSTRMIDPAFAEKLRDILQPFPEDLSPFQNSMAEQFRSLTEGIPQIHGKISSMGHEGRHRAALALMDGEEAMPVMLRSSGPGTLEEVLKSPATFREGPSFWMGEAAHSPSASPRVSEARETARMLGDIYPAHEPAEFNDMIREMRKRYDTGMEDAERWSYLIDPPFQARPKISGDLYPMYENLFENLMAPGGIRSRLLGDDQVFEFQDFVNAVNMTDF